MRRAAAPPSEGEQGTIERALAAPADTRFFLLHGPDEAGSRGLLKSLASAMGDDSERIDLSGADLKADPARLADEARRFRCSAPPAGFWWSRRAMNAPRRPRR
jgi:hypothetical protein